MTKPTHTKSRSRKQASLKTTNNTEEVGYKNPPKSTQFKPGKSGNPRGRPKKSRNTTLIIRETFEEKVEIREQGIVRKVNKFEAVIKRLMNEALNGNLRAIELCLKYAAEHTDINTTPQFSPTDIEALMGYRDRVIKSSQRKTSSGKKPKPDSSNP